MSKARPWVVSNEKEIKGFFEEPFGNRWLSNFWPCDDGVWYEGLKYLNAESAYQAQKVEPQCRDVFTTMGAGTAKKAWLNYPKQYTRLQWESVKLDIMSAIIFEKFFRNLPLRRQLIETGQRYLEETNDWNDIFWGADPVIGGYNHLGKILMKVRAFWA